MFINLPYGIQYNVRKDAMRPYFLKDKGGLDRYTGMTVGAKTKKNKKLSEKFRMKQEINEKTFDEVWDNLDSPENNAVK